MTEKNVRELVLAHEQVFLPDRAKGINAVVQYYLTGDEGGDWVVTIQDGTCKVREGKVDNPRITLTADASIFRDILLGRMDGMAAFMQGKFSVRGDLMLGMKLTGLFKLT